MEQPLDANLVREAGSYTAKEIADINLIKIDINDDLKRVRVGRTIVVILAGLALIGIGISWYYNPFGADAIPTLIEGCVMMLIYLGTAIYYPKNPVLSLSIALGLYILNQLLVGIVSPEFVFRGIIIKAIIIGGLVRSLLAALNVRKSLKKLIRKGIPEREISLVRDKMMDIPHTPRLKKD